MIQAKCKRCKYYSKETVTCDFLLKTGVRRGCPAKNCTRFDSGKKNKFNPLPPEFRKNDNREKADEIKRFCVDIERKYG